VIGFLHRYSK